MEHNKVIAKGWVRATLFTAFLYSTVWGVITIFLPHVLFINAQLDLPEPLFIWQTIGLVDIVFGIGYLIALQNPYRNWHPILMGVIYKFFSMVLYFSAVQSHTEFWSMKNFMFIDNLIWLIPFALILYRVYKRSYERDETLMDVFDEEAFTLDMFDTSEGIDLEATSMTQPTLVVMLRHFGCTFCREALSELAEIRGRIERKGTKLVLVHMLEDEDLAHEQLYKYGLEDVATISDPEEILYKRFKLKKGSLNQLLGIKDLYRGFIAGVIHGHGIGKEMGDMMQMPGVFLIYKGEVIKSFVHEHSSDRPPYLELADCNDCSVPA